MKAEKACYMPECVDLSEIHFAAVTQDDGCRTVADVLHADVFEILPEFPSNSFDAVVTDFPYNEIDAEWDIDPFPIEEFLTECDRVLSSAGVIIVFCSSRQLARVENCLLSFKDEKGNRIYRVQDGIWGKQNPVPLRPGITNCKENMVIAYTRDCENLQKKRLDAPFNVVTSSLITPTERVKDSDTGKNLHETQKPIEMLTKLLHKFIPPGSRVLDGTGGTMAIARACLVNGYNSVSIERDRRFFENGSRAFLDSRVMTACYDRKQVALDNLSLGHAILREIDHILAGERYLSGKRRKKAMAKISKIYGMGLVKGM